jgi:hypothetical protein
LDRCRFSRKQEVGVREVRGGIGLKRRFPFMIIPAKLFCAERQETEEETHAKPLRTDTRPQPSAQRHAGKRRRKGEQGGACGGAPGSAGDDR